MRMRSSSSSRRMRMRMEWHKGIFRIPLHYIPKALMTGGKGGYEESGEKLLIVREMSDGHQDDDEKARQLVPKGFLAVYVGRELRRFVIPASYLSMPDFRGLMEKAAEEFGYEQEGGLRIPCEEEEFEDILQSCLSRHQIMSNSKKNQIMFMFMSKSTKNQIMFMSKSTKKRD